MWQLTKPAYQARPLFIIGYIRQTCFLTPHNGVIDGYRWLIGKDYQGLDGRTRRLDRFVAYRILKKVSTDRYPQY